MDRFKKRVKGYKLLTIFENYSILDFWQGSEYASGTCNMLIPNYKPFIIFPLPNGKRQLIKQVTKYYIGVDFLFVHMMLSNMD